MPSIEEKYGIPDYMIAGLRRYIEYHSGVGHFLTAILENNLKEAVFHADGTNIDLLPNYVRYLHQEAPSQCWGSKERVKDWLDSDGDINL